MFRLALIIIASTLISACGWQLRGLSTAPLPSSIHFSSMDRLSAFSAALAENLQNFGIESKPTAAIKLVVGKEKLEKRTVAVTNIGTAAQYEIRISVPYQFVKTNEKTPVLEETMQTASAVRLFDFETGTNLSKTQEENLLLDEMRNEIALFIIQESRRHTLQFEQQ